MARIIECTVLKKIICRKCKEPRYVYGTLGKFGCTACDNDASLLGFTFETEKIAREI